MKMKISSTLKKLDNGNIEILFTIFGDLILSTKEKVLKELAKNISIAGFRKGYAPLNKVEDITPDEKLTELILNKILPKAFVDSVIEHKFNPAIYPKYEVIKITSSKNVVKDSEWQIKAITCELPKVVLPKNYKKKLKFDKKDQNLLIKSLLETIKFDIPKILIEEETNNKLAQTLERIEKLGLTLESYLRSVNKTSESLRNEYEAQSKEAIALELILNQIANDEKIEVSEDEIDNLIKTTGEEISKVEENKRAVLKRVILRKKALEKLSQK